ncbi:MAG TPA: response regulator [Gemmatimonadales bacterium]|nr:response regulator [Gemmatimonadales bacterium]
MPDVSRRAPLPAAPALAPLPPEALAKLSLVGEMTLAMSQATTAAEIYRQALAAIARVAETPRASVLLFDPDGVLRFKAWQGISDGYRAAVEGHTPWAPGQPAPDPIHIPDVSRDTSLGRYQPIILGEGIRALGFFPLVTGGGTIGKFMVYWDRPHTPAPLEFQLVRNIAAHTSFALDRQRLVDELQAERRLFIGGPTVLFQWARTEGWPVDYVSPNVTAQFGWRPEDLVGRRMPFADLIHPEDLPRVVDEIRSHHAAGRGTFEQEYRIRDAEGQWHWVSDFTVLPPKDGSVAHSIGYLVDITERKAAAAALQGAESRLREAQRLESLGVLAGGIAHDFNNLLMGMLGNAALALNDLPVASPTAETVKDIETAARRAADLTRQLLAYSGKGQFVVQPLDLSALVEESGQLLRTVISKRATMQARLAAGLPAVEGDATQLRQVAMNLLTNASDALGDQPGVIGLETALVHADRVTLTGMLLGDALPEGDYVALSVHDTGSGMDEETLGRIFDPFFTTKFHGRGLGLAAVLGIVRGHRGAIQVESWPGQGTRVRILLPATTRPVSPEAPPRPSGPARVADAGTVLVVDDEEIVRNVTRRTLERAGYTVLLAEHGLQALALLEERHAEVSLVLLDLTMPELGGEETFRRIHAAWPGLPVILSSGFTADQGTARLTSAGLADFIQKPYQPAALLEAARAAIQRAAG